MLVCLGDSITHGIMSARWVEPLEHELADAWDVVNAGVSGDLSENAVRRLDSVIACDPDVVVLLIGTNDVAAHISADWMKGYLRDQKPSQPLSLQTYATNLRTVFGRLQTETGARVICLDLPLLTEDLESVENQRVDEYNATLRAVAGEFSVAVLSVHAAMAKALRPGEKTPEWDGSKTLMMRGLLQRWVLRRSYNSISARNGLQLLTDNIHLNEQAALIVKSLVERELSL